MGKIPTGVVAITGAGAGLGQGLAEECARRGMHVLGLIQNDSQRAALEAATKGLAGKVDIQVLDVTQVDSFAFPPDIEVLVNNAGIRLKTIPVEEIPLEEWRLYFEVNFFGAVDLTRRAIPIMRQRKRGVICNINSASICMPLPFLGPYRATKGALAAFSETLRAELAPFGIRIVEILPGGMNTGMNKDSMTKGVAYASVYPPYAPMVEKQLASFKASGFHISEISEAATRIVDAICEGGGRMRYGTCAGSEAAIEAWRDPGAAKP